VIKIWDTVSGHELLTIHASSPELTYIDLSPDGKVLVSAGSDGMVNVFRADDY
jgi:WD40 repeat protein